ncbi:hypothetical protein C0J52_19916, partial [Blattella germanica]
HWHTLDYSRSFTFHRHNTTLRITNNTIQPGGGQHGMGSSNPQGYHSNHGVALSLGLTGDVSGSSLHQEMRVVCTEVKLATHEVAHLITHFTMGCITLSHSVVFKCEKEKLLDIHITKRILFSLQPEWLRVHDVLPPRWTCHRSTHAMRSEDACQLMHFDKNNLPFVTLVTTRPEPRQCPYLGKFSVTGLSREDGLVRSARRRKRSDTHLVEDIGDLELRNNMKDKGLNQENGYTDFRKQLNRKTQESQYSKIFARRKRSIQWLMEYSGIRRRSSRDLDSLPPDPCAEREDFTTLVVGCNTMDTMEFHSECTSADVVSVYSCHGRWEDNGTNYLITTPLSRSSRGPRRYCFMYREAQDGVVHFSSSSDSCRRNINPGVGGAMAFNVTSTGKAIDPCYVSGYLETPLIIIQ